MGAAASSSAVVVSKGVAASSSGSSSSANSNVTSNKGWKKRSSIQLPSSSEEADKSFGPGDFNPAKSAAKINPDPPAGSAPFLNKSKIHQENKEKMALDTQWPPRFSKLLLETRSLKDSSDVDEYSYDDTRKFGYVYVLNLDRDFVAGWDFEHCKASGVGDVDLLWPNLEFVARMKKDPFTELPSLAEFEHLLENLRWKSSSGEKKVPSPLPIKTLLLDQEKVLCGLGNWLVDDVLFDCGIHPNEFVDEILKGRRRAEMIFFQERLRGLRRSPVGRWTCGGICVVYSEERVNNVNTVYSEKYEEQVRTKYTETGDDITSFLVHSQPARPLLSGRRFRAS